MEKEFIKNEFSFLEEQLERIANVASKNELSLLADSASYDYSLTHLLEEATASLRGLGKVVREEALKQKSVSALEFLAKISRFLVQESTREGVDVNIVQSADGKVSLEAIEGSTHAILACIRAWIALTKKVSEAKRLDAGLFSTPSVTLHVQSTVQELYFCFLDDGAGLCDDLGAEAEAKHQADIVRSTVAKSGGWFQQQPAGICGQKIELKIPVANGRMEAWLIQSGDFRALCPVFSMKEFDFTAEAPVLTKGVLATIDPKLGLAPIIKIQEGHPRITMGVADQQVTIAFDKEPERVVCRKIPAKEFFQDGTWISELGIFTQGEETEVLPILTGSFLIRYCLSKEKKNEDR